MEASSRARLRAVLGWVGAALLVVGAPTAFAQNWPPAVIVQSSSMMHADAEVTYGRVGTIDPGDLVLVKRVDAPEDVLTFVEAGPERYADPGDVIVYYPANDRSATPIIHRAMAYVDVEGETYRVRWSADAPCEGGAEKDGGWCVYGPDGVLVPSAGIRWTDGGPWKPNADGFITKGDNPVSNRVMDPAGISHDEAGQPSVVRLEWIEGKARGELPWLGLVKLALAGEPNEDRPPASYVKVGSAYAPMDLWVSLALALAALVGGPIAFDAWKAWRARRT